MASDSFSRGTYSVNSPRSNTTALNAPGTSSASRSRTAACQEPSGISSPAGHSTVRTMPPKPDVSPDPSDHMPFFVSTRVGWAATDGWLSATSFCGLVVIA